VVKTLNSVCTDNAPAFTGRHSGCVYLLEKFLCIMLMKYFIICQENLYGKFLDIPPGLCSVGMIHTVENISLGAFVASELDVVFSGYQPR
jgi:hypothetical protein